MARRSRGLRATYAWSARRGEPGASPSGTKRGIERDELLVRGRALVDVRLHEELAPRLQQARHLLEQPVLHHEALVVPLLPPGVGEVHEEPPHRAVRPEARQGVARVLGEDARARREPPLGQAPVDDGRPLAPDLEPEQPARGSASARSTRNQPRPGPISTSTQSPATRLRTSMRSPSGRRGASSYGRAIEGGGSDSAATREANTGTTATALDPTAPRRPPSAPWPPRTPPRRRPSRPRRLPRRTRTRGPRGSAAPSRRAADHRGRLPRAARDRRRSSRRSGTPGRRSTTRTSTSSTPAPSPRGTRCASRRASRSRAARRACSGPRCSRRSGPSARAATRSCGRRGRSRSSRWAGSRGRRRS